MRERLTASTGQKREIPDDFKYNPKKVKHIKKVLHNINVALGTLTSALNELSRVKGRDLSPDGLLGGKGYIIELKELKKVVKDAVHGLSGVADSLADELTNPKWEAKEDKEVKKLVKEKNEIQEKVEDEINPDDLVTVDDEDDEEEENKEDSENSEDSEKEKPEEKEEDSENVNEEQKDNEAEEETSNPNIDIRKASLDVYSSEVKKSLINYFVNKGVKLC